MTDKQDRWAWMVELHTDMKNFWRESNSELGFYEWLLARCENDLKINLDKS